MSQPLSKLESEIIKTITDFISKITHGLENIKYRGTNIGREFLIVIFLANQEELQMKDVVDYLDTIPSTATRKIGKLVELGLLKRMNSKKDRRIVNIRLTEEGKELYSTFMVKRFLGIKKIQQEFTEQEIRGFLKFINRFLELSKELEI
ncbi:MAG: MarR family winged helix-turn-helix transcriptional regulator [Candidatus Hermodarchaeota archaeon]